MRAQISATSQSEPSPLLRNTAPAVDLRERLIAMRDSLVEVLARDEYLDGGRLTLLGQVGAAIVALDAGKN